MTMPVEPLPEILLPFRLGSSQRATLLDLPGGYPSSHRRKRGKEDRVELPQRKKDHTHTTTRGSGDQRHATGGMGNESKRDGGARVDNSLYRRIRQAAGGFCSNPNRQDKDRQPEVMGSEYLGGKSTHIDGELEGIALALEKHTEKGTNMVALLSDCKTAIRTVEKLDRGEEAPLSHIEARILNALETREHYLQETYMAWVKGHKDIQGNVKADKLSKEASILGHEFEGVVTPAGLRAWARRERKEARGGGGEGILGWHRKAVSAYTWCVTGKGPQRKWLHHPMIESKNPTIPKASFGSSLSWGSSSYSS